MEYWELFVTIYLFIGGVFTYYYYTRLPPKYKDDKLVTFIVAIGLNITWPFVIAHSIYSVITTPEHSISLSQRMYELNKKNAQNSPHIQWIDYNEFNKY
jgi:hypothetical protein